jgi:hypothetical protein
MFALVVGAESGVMDLQPVTLMDSTVLFGYDDIVVRIAGPSSN